MIGMLIMKYTCDIILLSYENPDLLERCVESVLENTAVSSRLIIVDNNSRNPEVKNYLKKIHGRGNIEIEKVFSEENAGFAGGMNKGLNLSTAPFVCLLNNDCEVYAGWLDEMIKIAMKEDNIGLVNPQSNTFGCHEPLSVKDKRGRFIELGHAIGFACLIKREVIDRIGILDEAYEGVCYEDTDFSCRAAEAGFIAVMAEGAYVHHQEQASRASLKGRKEIYQHNKELFELRWGKLLRILFVGSPYPHGSLIEDYQKLKNIARERSIIEMWTKNEEKIEIMDGLKSKNIIKHADIGIRSFSEDIKALKLINRVLTKKKRYDAVITRDVFLFRVLGLVSRLRHTKIFLLKDNKYLISGKGAVTDIKESSLLAQSLREDK